MFNLTRGLYPYPQSADGLRRQNDENMQYQSRRMKNPAEFSAKLCALREIRFSFRVRTAFLEVLKIQTEGKREMTVADYLKGKYHRKRKKITGSVKILWTFTILFLFFLQ
ncbi:MAG: hypothetical protein L6V93_11035 [Clostridiales bacterium]|nr:MAG: hypothetical protein L6V93_11035 [Clostridiales bacterium]